MLIKTTRIEKKYLSTKVIYIYKELQARASPSVKFTMNQTAKLAELQEMCLNEHMNLNKLRDKLQNTLHRMEISLCMTGTISAVLKDRVNIINGSIRTQIEFIHLKLTEMHVLTTEMETQSSE